MLVDFKGYGLDFIIVGRLELTASRLTDMLNETSTLDLHDVVLEGLVDLARVAVPDYSIGRDELLAVKVAGPRGRRLQRMPTTRHRVQAQLGPYNVLGRLHTGPGETVPGSVSSRGPMLPLTDATIAYVVGGILEVRDAATILINRELANWVRDEETNTLVVPNRTPVPMPFAAVAADRNAGVGALR
jgi:hypothetical protein